MLLRKYILLQLQPQENSNNYHILMTGPFLACLFHAHMPLFSKLGSV